MRPYYYLGGRRALTELVTGQPFIVNTDSLDIATWIVRDGFWEEHVDKVLSALVGPGDVVFDIGANMGYYSVKLGGLAGPMGQLFCFEPNPEMFEVLAKNLQVNDLAARATAVQAAVGDGNCSAPFGFDRHYPGGGQVGGLTETREAIEVKMVRIDDVVPVDCVADVIKMDIEGYEILALKGMTGLLARSPDAAIVLEVSYPQWITFGSPAQLLREIAGKRDMFVVRRNQPLQPIEGEALDAVLAAEHACYILMRPTDPERQRRLAEAFVPAPKLEPEPKWEPPSPPPKVTPLRWLWRAIRARI